MPVLRMPAAAASLLFAITACATAAAPSARPTTSGSLSPVAAVVRLVPEEVKKKGSLNNAIYNDAPPQMFLESNKLVGIQPDLAKAVSEVMGVPFTNIPTGSFDSIIPGLQGGRYDVSFADFGVTAKRMEVVDFVEQFSLGTGFATKQGAGKPITAAGDLCGRTIAVLAGSYFVEQLGELNTGCAAAGKPAIVSQTYPTASAAILAVSNGRAEAFSSSQDQLGYAAKQQGARLDAQPFVYKPVPQAIALPKGSKLAKAIQAAMAELVRNGEYAKILAKWGIADVAVDRIRINPTSAS